MAVNIKSKEIQVQKPAQSLQAFQQSLNTGDDLHQGLLKPVLIGAGAALVLTVGFFGIRAWRHSVVEKHEAALAELVQEAQGDGITPVAPEEMEKRMKERLGRLELLAKNAPSASRTATAALLASWKLTLEGKGAVEAKADDPWGSLRIAQKALAMGKAQEAAAALAPLRKSAGPEEAWATLFWATQLEADRLAGNREQAWKDLADYKARFKDRGDAASLEKLIQGI